MCAQGSKTINVAESGAFLSITGLRQGKGSCNSLLLATRICIALGSDYYIKWLFCINLRIPLFSFQDQYDRLSLHTHKGIEFLDRYGNFIKDRSAIENEYASKLRWVSFSNYCIYIILLVESALI